MAELARAHRTFLAGLASKLCRTHFDPDDLVQDVLERVVRHHDRLPPGTNHGAWMARVMRNLHIDRIRRRIAAPAPASLDPATLPAAEPEARSWWTQLDLDEVRRRVAALPDELRVPIELFALEGCSYQQIASRLGVPRCTVATRIGRARRRLRASYDEAAVAISAGSGA